MGINEQWKTIKQNWLIAVVLLLVVLVPMFSGSTGYLGKSAKDFGGYAVEEMAMARAPMGIMYDESFAPEVEERKITKTASISNEVERGKYREAETRLKAIVAATDSYLLNENVHKSGEGRRSYYSGNYQLKVAAGKYDAVLSQLKALGEVQSFNENARDITERHEDLNIELAAEKARLTRFKEMYEEAERVEDKIQLTDKMFDLERRISYIEEALENVDNRVEYSTISMNLREGRSSYANTAFVKFSELVKKLVDSVNGVLSLLFWVVPWVITGLIAWLVVRLVRKRR